MKVTKNYSNLVFVRVQSFSNCYNKGGPGFLKNPTN
jgi:hypothetical protein